MAMTTIYPATDEGREFNYTPQFNKWLGFYQTNPVLRSIINAQADAITTSWKVRGSNQRNLTKMLNEINGHGKQTFKMILNLAEKNAIIAGDAYIEILRRGEEITNLRVLNPQTVAQNIKDGVTQSYEDMNNGHKWKPNQILHIENNPIGWQPHGRSDVEPMLNLLLDMAQIWDDMSRIYHRYIRPMELVYTTTDHQPHIDLMEQKWMAARERPENTLFLPDGMIKKVERVAVPQGGVLDPAQWEKILIQRMLQSYRVPELALGTGTANSEESARMLHSGFRQLVRWKQQFLEDSIEAQLFRAANPTTTAKLELSFAAEPEEERFSRMQGMFRDINNSVLNDNLKGMLLEKLLREMNLV